MSRALERACFVMFLNCFSDTDEDHDDVLPGAGTFSRGVGRVGRVIRALRVIKVIMV